VVIVARGEERLKSVAAESRNISWIAESVATPDARMRIVEKTLAGYGKISSLIHCAARPGYHDRPVWEMSLDDWREAMAVNLEAAFDLTRLVLKGMVAMRSGSIVMVASVAGLIGTASKSAYCSSKAGLLGLVRAVAWDVAPFDVRCNAVCPGWVRETATATEGSERLARATGRDVEEIWSERAARYPDRRLVTVDEVARAVVFLVSEQSSGINGEELIIAHGGTW
jgi:NAD(P)-dependent dehydrogenase (short-subunit alcohol dehydrogenase family)